MVSKTSPLSTPIADIGADILFRRLGPIRDSCTATNAIESPFRLLAKM
jgi:hypothetical protein